MFYNTSKLLIFNFTFIINKSKKYPPSFKIVSKCLRLSILLEHIIHTCLSLLKYLFCIKYNTISVIFLINAYKMSQNAYNRLTYACRFILSFISTRYFHQIVFTNLIIQFIFIESLEKISPPLLKLSQNAYD